MEPMKKRTAVAASWLLWLWLAAVIVGAFEYAPLAAKFIGQSSRILFFHLPIALGAFTAVITAGPAARPRRARGDRARAAVRPARDGHRGRLVAHHVGRLLELGPAADLDRDGVDLQRRLPGAARRGGGRREARPAGGGG